MKKNYIRPLITVELIEEDTILAGFSKEVVDTIGEGDTTPEAPSNGGDSETGEGLNAKKGGFFNFDWDD